MKNHSFKQTIALSLLASMSLCNAEEDGAFFVIDYQTSLARQELKNPGFTQAQELKQLIRDGAVRLQTSAIPLSYYLDILGNKTKTLLSESVKNNAQASQQNGQSHQALVNLEQSLGILGKLLDLSQQYASQGVIKPLVVDVGKQQIGITDSMLSVAQNIVLALGQVDLSKIQQNNQQNNNNQQLYENIVKVMLLGAGGTNGAYNGVSVGDIATGMQNFSSQTGLIGANSTVSEINALIKSGISLDRETLGLGGFIEKNICSNALSCFSGNQLIYRKGLDRVIGIINTTLNQFESSASSLYKISYIPNLFSLRDYQSASMNGFGAKMGYKQFFTHKKNIGLRYYGFLDYGYANFGDTNLKVGANLVTYGVGTDFLYNFFERSRRRERTAIGLFFGAQIAGQTWSTNVTNLLSGQRPDVKSSSFQFLFDLGLRTNFAKTNFNKHKLDQGIEFGVKIPVIAHKYFATQGSSASYMRNFSFYVGYSVGF